MAASPLKGCLNPKINKCSRLKTRCTARQGTRCGSRTPPSLSTTLKERAPSPALLQELHTCSGGKKAISSRRELRNRGCSCKSGYNKKGRGGVGLRAFKQLYGGQRGSAPHQDNKHTTSFTNNNYNELSSELATNHFNLAL